MKPVFSWRAVLLPALAFTATIANTAHAQQAPLPKSGALVALSTGQTLWIAPIDGKMQVLATNDYIIPRKDGFWYLDADIFPPKPPEKPQGDESAAATTDAPETDAQKNPSISLWAVQLKPGAKLPREIEAEKVTNSAAPAGEAANADDSAANMDNDNGIYRQTILFLSPDYLSLKTQQGEYHEDFQLYKFTSLPEDAKGPAALFAEPFTPPIAKDVLARDQDECGKGATDPDDHIGDADFLAGANQYFGIRRVRHRWEYAWLFGYDYGAARGYATECGVSAAPPRSIVGPGEIFPPWNEIKNAFPNAVDSFASPTRDVVLVVLPDRLVVAPVSNGKVGRSLLRVQITESPIMVQWSTGAYVDRWTAQLKPFLSAYTYKEAKPQ